MRHINLTKVVDFKWRLCRSGVSPDIERLTIAGEAVDVSQAYEFFERVKKTPLLQDYDWTSRQPQLAGRNKVRFEMEGARPDAQTGEE